MGEDFHQVNLSLFSDFVNESLVDNLTMFFNGGGGLEGSPEGGGGSGGGKRPNSPIMLPYKYELDMSIQITLYSTIFLLAVVGNSLVILTLVQNQGMRTITNLFLLNLAIADLLVGVFCMPFTLVGIVLKDFVFGSVLCKLIPYLQAVSVAVSAWTLVAISVERYYAICHPLTSRRWQTLSHAYKIIAIVWIASLLCMCPIFFVSLLQPIRKTGRHKCREEWPSETLEKIYTLFLDIVLLVLPLIIMAVKYGLITCTLWPSFGNTGEGDQFVTEQSSILATNESVTPGASPRLPSNAPNNASASTPLANNATPKNIAKSMGASLASSFRRHVRRSRNNESNSPSDEDVEKNPRMVSMDTDDGVDNERTSLKSKSASAALVGECSSAPISPGFPNPNDNSNQILNRTSSTYSYSHNHHHHPRDGQGNATQTTSLTTTTSVAGSSSAAIQLRRCNQAKSLKRKKRVIQMLSVVVVSFFLCWAPLYLMNTWYLFSPTELYEMIGHVGVSLIQLLAYISCCCNPITLCVMSKGFRTAFYHAFGCHNCGSNSSSIPTTANNNNNYNRHSSTTAANNSVAHPPIRGGVDRDSSIRLSRNRSMYTPTTVATTVSSSFKRSATTDHV